MVKIKTKNKSITLQTDAIEFVNNLAIDNGLSFSSQLNLLVKGVMNAKNQT